MAIAILDSNDKSENMDVCKTICLGLVGFDSYPFTRLMLNKKMILWKNM